MSLVGPRPLVPDEDAQIAGLAPPPPAPDAGHDRPLADPRLGAHPAAARWSSIDYLYVANWSLWSDVKILLRTLVFVVMRRGL